MWVASSKSTKRSVAYHVSCVPYTFTYDRGSFARHRAHRRKDWRLERDGKKNTSTHIYILEREDIETKVKRRKEAGKKERVREPRPAHAKRSTSRFQTLRFAS